MLVKSKAMYIPSVYTLYADRNVGNDLNSTSRLQQSRQLSLHPLQVGVPSDMLLLDIHVGHGALVREFLESVLDVTSVICSHPTKTY